MTHKDLSKAKNPDLRASFVALQRAAAIAREIAIQTNTAIVIMKDGKITHVPAELLREDKS
jgi:hypothetical protein